MDTIPIEIKSLFPNVRENIYTLCTPNRIFVAIKAHWRLMLANARAGHTEKWLPESDFHLEEPFAFYRNLK